MNITTITIDVEDVFNAIKVDGYEHLRSEWLSFKKFDGKIRPVGACLVGGAAVNLGVVADREWIQEAAAGELDAALTEQGEEYWNPEINSWDVKDDPEVDIYGLFNALNKFTLDRLSPDLASFNGLSLGDALVEANDKIDSDGEYAYSYDTLVDIAKIFMEPFFGKTIKVTEIDYTDASILNV